MSSIDIIKTVEFEDVERCLIAQLNDSPALIPCCILVHSSLYYATGNRNNTVTQIFFNGEPALWRDIPFAFFEDVPYTVISLIKVNKNDFNLFLSDDMFALYTINRCKINMWHIYNDFIYGRDMDCDKYMLSKRKPSREQVFKTSLYLDINRKKFDAMRAEVAESAYANNLIKRRFLRVK